MTKGLMAIASALVIASLLTGCNNSNATSDSESKSTSSNAVSITEKLASASVTDANNSEITVKASIQNKTDKAVFLQASELALVVSSTSTVLSPSKKSQIPSQVPANSAAQIYLIFDNGGKIKNGDSAKLGFQPNSNQPEQFSLLNRIVLKNDSNDSEATPSPKEEAYELALLQPNGTKEKLPIVWVKAKYEVSMSRTPSLISTAPLPDIPFTISPDLAKQLSAFWVNRGDGHGLLFLGPRDWIPTDARFGADGSYMITIQSQTDSTNKLTYMSDGACRGCAISDIGTYFKDLRNWSSEQGFPPPNLPFVFDTSNAKNGIATYQINTKINGYETIGAAYEQSSGNVTFSKEEITVPTSQDTLAAMTVLFYAETLKGS